MVPVDSNKRLQIKELMFHDTFCLAYLWDSSLKSKGLKALSESLLGMKMLELTDIFQTKKDIKFYTLDPINDEKTTVYAASDAICTYHLYQKLKHVADEQAFIYYLERRCTFAIRQMERNKCLIDIEKIKEFKSILLGLKLELQDEATKILGYSANLASPAQVGKILTNPPFNLDIYAKDDKGNYLIEKGVKKIETGEEALKPFIDTCPLIDIILTLRDINKTVGTYLDNFLTRADEFNEVKFKFVPWRVETGRFASQGGEAHEGYSGVNIQALTKPLKKKDKYDKNGNPIPILELVKKKGSGFFLRSCIRARPGYKLAAIDYSGQELRVAANVSQEKIWIKEFLEGTGDLHTETAKIVFKTQNPDGHQRDASKAINFQTLYGGGPSAISRKIKSSFEEAKEFQQRMIGGLGDLKRWMDTTKKKSHKNMYAATPLGRRRPLPMIKSEINRERAESERLAINTPIQGAGGDIMKMAMVRTNEYIAKSNDEVRMLITVHDELVFEIKEDRMDVHIPELMNLMSMDTILQGVLKWAVPLSMDCEVGDNWDVEYEYFQKNAHLLEKLNDNLRLVKALAMSLDPKTLKPVGEDSTQATEKIEQKIEQLSVPKEETLNDDFFDIESLSPENAAKAVEMLTEGQHTIPHEHVDLLPEHEIIAMDNFDENSLKNAIDAFKNYCTKDPEKAFLVGISEYIKNLNSLKVVGKEIQNEIRKKPTAWMSYEYKMKSSFITEQKMYQIEALIKMCKGTNPYKITMQQQIIAQGNDLDANRFDTLADYLNI
jgi:DNA polymerase I-like protein with 3'-5' exonuclease and polymerase domains